MMGLPVNSTPCPLPPFPLTSLCVKHVESWRPSYWKCTLHKLFIYLFIYDDDDDDDGDELQALESVLVVC